ncbi:MAG: hypothetical protein AAF967_05775 [Pseudomonadota bacterium]
MRKRRAWSSLDDDADEQESAALAASLAAAKDTAARSDALLSSAKEDLTDHQRWLETQTAAVERGRDRHERWLQRQKDLRAASAKKDRVRRHRRLVRRRAVQAIRDAFIDLFVFVRSWVGFGAGKVVSGFRLVTGSISRGVIAIWRGFAGAVSSISRGILHGLSATVRSLRHALGTAGQGLVQGARHAGNKVGLAARGAGAGIAAGAAWSGSRATASVRAGGDALSAGSQAVAAKAGKVSRQAGDALGSGGRALGDGLVSTGDSAAALAAATRDGVSTRATVAASRASAVASRAVKLGATGAQGLLHALTAIASRAAAIPSRLFIHIARLGHEVQHFARVRAAVPRTPAPSTDQDVRAPFAILSDVRACHTVTDDVPAPGHTASVHVFESYGPHPYGTMLFGQPANEPWSADLNSSADDYALDVSAKADGSSFFSKGLVSKGIGSSLAIPVGIGSAVAAGMAGVSSLGQSANNRAVGFAQVVRRHASAGSIWFRKQAARAGVLAQSSAAAAVRSQEAMLARGTDWAQKRGVGFSEMMIVAGAVLLVIGGLLIGGGFLLRSTSEPVIAAEPSDETFSKISWAFDQPALPLQERAVFTLSGSPQSFLINGISITGTNNSDETLTDLGATLSPDVKRPDLVLDVVAAAQPADAPEPSRIAAVPPGDAFRLSFQFPPEAMGSEVGSENGISVEEFFESYGGLLLKIRYGADGAERSIIQYLDPEMLKAQLNEVAAQAGGS